MRMIADNEVQARIMKEIKELYEKRGKLEADIRAVDALNKHLMETGALRDIDAYRTLNRSPASA
jgi:hypothetical protein